MKNFDSLKWLCLLSLMGFLYCFVSDLGYFFLFLDSSENLKDSASIINIIIENSKTSFKFVKNYLEEYGFKCYRYQNGSFTNQKLNEALNLYFLK